MTEDTPASWYSYPQLLKRTLSCLLPQKEGEHSPREWWRIDSPVAAMYSPAKKFILSQPIGKAEYSISD